MKKEHFGHVSEKFDLVKYDPGNSVNTWSADMEGSGSLSTLFISRGSEGFDVRARNFGGSRDVYMFIELLSHELAEEVVQYIKDTEILFL